MLSARLGIVVDEAHHRIGRGLYACSRGRRLRRMHASRRLMKRGGCRLRRGLCHCVARTVMRRAGACCVRPSSALPLRRGLSWRGTLGRREEFLQPVAARRQLPGHSVPPTRGCAPRHHLPALIEGWAIAWWIACVHHRGILSESLLITETFRLTAQDICYRTLLTEWRVGCRIDWAGIRIELPCSAKLGLRVRLLENHRSCPTWSYTSRRPSCAGRCHSCCGARLTGNS